MIIRAACTEDAGAIAPFLNQVIDETTITFTTARKSNLQIATEIADRDGAYFVAEDDGQVVGFATYFPFRAGPGYARTKEHTVVLAPAARGLGAGRGLMLALTDHALQARVHSMWAGVSAENPTGVAFHAALGFREVAVLPEVGYKFGRWIDLVLMQKIL